MEKSLGRKRMRLTLRGMSAEVKRKSRRKKSARSKNGSSIIENSRTKIEGPPSELEGLKNIKRIKFNTGGIQYRRSIGFPALFSFLYSDGAFGTLFYSTKLLREERSYSLQRLPNQSRLPPTSPNSPLKLDQLGLKSTLNFDIQARLLACFASLSKLLACKSV
ncbi:hypothetical protein GOBAR_DD04919 [Gossypium barbadense]|nr:hypothetical protein GOBAR_DD04919 [Gossypium barbadense]